MSLSAGCERTRGEIVLRGIFDTADEYVAVEEGARERTGNNLRTVVGGQRFQFRVDSTRYPTAKDARQDGRLTLDDARRFEISGVRPDGLSRAVFTLVVIK